MSERNWSVVRAASTQLSKSDTTTFSEEPTYAVKLDDDIVKDVLPILMPKLLEVISNPGFNSELKQTIFQGDESHEIACGQYNRTSRNEVSRSNSNQSDTSTSLLLPRDNNAQGIHILNSGIDSGQIFYEQGRLQSRSTKQGDIADGNLCSWVTLQRLSCAISLIVVTVVVTLAGISIVWHVWFSINTENSIPFSSIFTKINSNDDAYEFMVNSYEEYKSLLLRTDVSKIKLVININSPADWPIGVSIPNTKHIRRLFVKGHLHGNKLIDLLASISSIERLRIDNDGNQICSETQQIVGTLNTRFKAKTSITTLELTQFTASCTELLEYMHANLKVKNLENVIFSNGELCEYFVEPFQNLLLEHKQTLRHIEILETATNVTLFKQHKFQFLDKVKRLVLDIYGVPMAIGQTLTNICSMLPNVESLSLGKMLQKWEHMPNVFGCRRLKSFQFSMSLPKSSNNFSIDFLPEAFPYLLSLDIVIIFGDTLEETKCNERKSILGTKKMSDDLLVNTRITSNCELIFL